jgi:hypothetical protein
MSDPKGLFYRPSPPPQTNDPYAIRQWCEREFNRLADALQENRGIWIRLDELTEKPNRPTPGMVCYFAAGVVGVGSLEGSYEYVGSTWKKL